MMVYFLLAIAGFCVGFTIASIVKRLMEE